MSNPDHQDSAQGRSEDASGEIAAVGSASRDPRLDVPSALELSRGLAEVLEQLRASQDEQHELIRGIGHDFKSPLASATLLARALTSGQFGPMNADQIEAIETLTTSLGHMMHLADAIYTAASSRPQSNSAAGPQVGDLSKAAHGAVAAHRISAEIRHIELGATTPESALVRCDEVRLRRMVDNLVSNAVKFTDAGAVSLIVEPVDHAKVRLTVRDTGIGIPPEDLGTIGANFRRGANAQDRPGTGVGIAVVRRLAAEVGGTFAITSSLEHGTTAVLELSAATPTDRGA